MNIKQNVGQVLFNAVNKDRITFHTAIKVYKPINNFIVRSKAESSAFFSKKLVEFMTSASSPLTKSAWTSILFPAEILFAFDIYPLTLEVISGMFSTLNVADEFLSIAEAEDVPQTMCTFHRVLYGMSTTNFMKKPILVGAASTMCDGNLKSFADAAAATNVPFMFLDVPFEHSKEAREYLKVQIRDMLAKLSKLTKIKFKESKLIKIAKNVNKFIKLQESFYNLRKTLDKNLYQGHEIANLAFPMHFMLGSDVLNEVMERKCGDLENPKRGNKFFKNIETDKNVKRIMWCHIVPQYNTDIWDIIDDGIRAKIVCDEYSSPYYGAYDESDVIGSIADRLINHPSNGPIERRIEHILRIAKDFKVDGIVHYSSWGCHQGSGNIQILARAIQDAGYGFLNINGDPIDQKSSSDEQHRTRLEAFLGL